MEKIEYKKRASQNKNSIKVALVARSHGLKGDLFVTSLHSKPDWPEDMKSLQIGEQNFELERHSPHKSGFILKLKGCDSKAQADQLKFQEVFLDKNLFQSQSSHSFYLMELLGFSVEIEGDQGKGSVLHFESDSKNQDFLIIDFPIRGKTLHKKSYSIPFVKPYVKKIDFKKKEVLLKLPSDFLSLF